VADLQTQLRAVHCLRFLRDAFRTRPDCVDFEEQLSTFITNHLNRGTDLLAAKLALEATGLLSENTVETPLIAALTLENSWISATALRACRHLKRIGSDLEHRLQHYVRNIDSSEFLRRYREISFSLSLSDAFSRLETYCRIRVIQERMFLVGWAASVLVAPVLALLLLLLQEIRKLVPERRRFWWRVMTSGYFSLTLLLYLFIKVTRRDFGYAHHHATLLADLNANPLIPLMAFAHGTARSLVLAVSAALAIVCSPWLDLFDFARRVKWRGVLKYVSEPRVWIVLASMAAFWAAIWGIEHIWKRAAAMISYAVWSLMIVGAASWAVRHSLRLLRDRRVFQRATRTAHSDRTVIAENFFQFETGRYRRSYVEWLRDGVVNPQGEWPKSRPNVDDDEASTMLAQLDERWLGLDV
jgi:hypothetical protein